MVAVSRRVYGVLQPSSMMHSLYCGLQPAGSMKGGGLVDADDGESVVSCEWLPARLAPAVLHEVVEVTCPPHPPVEPDSVVVACAADVSCDEGFVALPYAQETGDDHGE